jgi:DNA repair protein RecO (recombination protein O)
MVTLLCEKTGKINAIAKGARNSKKRFLGGVDFFDCGQFELSKKKSTDTIYNLLGIQNRRVWPGLRENLSNFTLAAVALEVTNLFAQEGDPSTQSLFHILYKTLRGLNSTKTKDDACIVITLFLLLVLRDSGFDPTEDRTNIPEHEQQWWREMLAVEKPLMPSDTTIITHSALWLVRAIEKIVGYPLKTQHEMVLHSKITRANAQSNKGY